MRSSKTPLSLVVTICFGFVLITQLGSVIIDNEVETQPRVYCFQNGLKLQVETKNPFTGHIYVKGMYGNAQCNRNFTGETKQPSLNVAYAECIHNREPLLTGGMMFTLEVIVQFHPYFTTKIDRAFIVSCSYREAVNIVTQNQILQGNVMLPEGSSDSIPVTRVSYAPLMPNCQYTIHRGSPDGPLISFARVGEKVVHKWQCLPTADGEFHGILVHDCFARDVRGTNRIHILDKRGCTLDPFSLPTPTYTLDLTMGYAAVHAFKFADDLQISFACSISLCLRMNDGCVGISPPQCDGSQSTTSPTTPGQNVGAGSKNAGPPGYVPRPPGYSFSFQRSDPSDSIYEDIFGNFSSGDLLNGSLISIPHPPPANVLFESDSKPRKAELLIDPDATLVHDGRNLQAILNSSFTSTERDLDLPTFNSIQDFQSNATTTTTTTTTITTPTTTTTSSSSINPSNAVELSPFVPEEPATNTSTTKITSVESQTPIATSSTIHIGFQQVEIATNTSSPLLQPVQTNTTAGTIETNLGGFVGEGVINVQSVVQSAKANSDKHPSLGSERYYPPGFKFPASSTNNQILLTQDLSSFANSKQKDANPVVHIHRLIPGKVKKQHVQYIRSTTTSSPLFDYDDNAIEGSIDVTAQEFVVFDRRNPVMGFGNETWNEDGELIRHVNRNICITTFAFTQIVIAAAVVFSSLIAIAVFFHMRHRKKCTITDLQY